METFDVRVSTTVDAPADTVYRYVSDLERSGEWSPECTGGRWIEGLPGEVGSVFEGHNHRPTEVVAWAPVVRGTWTTECEVVEAKPPHTFRWAMRNSAKQAQESIWSFELDDEPTGTRLTHAFRMGERTEGLSQILGNLSEHDEARFLDEWSAKLRADMTSTIEQIKHVIESAPATRA
jgi:uncharacterized protein YndB with AHSA1/START domain